MIKILSQKEFFIEKIYNSFKFNEFSYNFSYFSEFFLFLNIFIEISCIL